MSPKREPLLARHRDGDRGFTLIELLVVVVIIGILIGIAIPLYLHYEQGAYLTTAKADLRTMELEEQNYYANYNTFGTTAQLISANPKLRLSKGTLGAVVWNSSNGYCVAALNMNGPLDSTTLYNLGHKGYYFTSTTAVLSDVLCGVPTGATPIDNHYVDETGGH